MKMRKITVEEHKEVVEKALKKWDAIINDIEKGRTADADERAKMEECAFCTLLEMGDVYEDDDRDTDEEHVIDCECCPLWKKQLCQNDCEDDIAFWEFRSSVYDSDMLKYAKMIRDGIKETKPQDWGRSTEKK